MNNINNTRINTIKPLISPEYLINSLPASEQVQQHVRKSRQAIQDVIHGKDPRLLVVVGPCSIHDCDAALAYAHRLKQLQSQFSKELCIVMRVYFEKPRTTIGWKGLINDPDLNNHFDIIHGLTTARQLLLDINELGLAVGTEFMDTITPQYIADLVSWGAIGARTTESQPHRNLASGLSMPIGFKNSTTGYVKVAADAVYAASHPHHFLGVTKQGLAAIVATNGNPDCHIILRGGSQTGPNYHMEDIADAKKLLATHQIKTGILVDCSHGNSGKDYRKQKLVVDSLCKQIAQSERDNCSIAGLMLESHLVEGNQALTSKAELVYGQSITDSCIGWEETEQLIMQLAKTQQTRFVAPVQQIHTKQTNEAESDLMRVRNNINAIDDRIHTLLDQRAALALKALAIKSDEGAISPTIYYPEREQEIMARLTQKNTEVITSESVSHIFQAIIKSCRKLQYDQLQNQKQVSIAIQGDKASFSEQAAKQFCQNNCIQNYHLDYAISSQAVIEKVKAGLVDYGVMAIYNGTGGAVKETIDAMNTKSLDIIAVIPLSVKQNLLVLPNISQNQIQAIYSHNQALRQCQQYLTKHYQHVKQYPVADTAIAARQLANGELPAHSAIIGNAACATQYGLKLLAADINDDKENKTTFIIVQAT